jgi:hypothetical protein
MTHRLLACSLQDIGKICAVIFYKMSIESPKLRKR